MTDKPNTYFDGGPLNGGIVFLRPRPVGSVGQHDSDGTIVEYVVTDRFTLDADALQICAYVSPSE